MESRVGRDAGDQEIADELGVTVDDYYQMLQDSASSKLFSYDEIVGDDDYHKEQLFNSSNHWVGLNTRPDGRLWLKLSAPAERGGWY